VFNAANEQAVEVFLQGKMAFGEIAPAIGAALDHFRGARGDTREALLAADAAARAFVKERFGC
jgi:1-deoxy-D-xylulose 5-phosphate reductoisomerase